MDCNNTTIKAEWGGYPLAMNYILSEKHTQAIHGILADNLEVTVDQLTPEASIQEDLGADSLTVMEIVMALEDHFSISLPDQRWERVRTVGDLFEIVAETLQQPGRI